MSSKVANGFRVIVEAFTLAGGQLARDVDSELTHHQEGEEDVVVQ